MSIFDFNNEDAIGSVYSVDTGTVLVSVSNIAALRRMQVNHLVVLRSSRAGQHLVGIINKIMRRALLRVDETDQDLDEDGLDDTLIVENILRVTLIGTLLDAVGTRQNVFRRTLETVPEIDARCFPLEGIRLTNFMRAISRQAGDGPEPLSLGKYSLDDESDAWIDGNRFFQRHAVVVGGTGSGKSWTIARVLEQVAELPSASAVLFDIHGEYGPLEGNGISHLRVAGPADVGEERKLADGVLFLPYWLLTYEEMLAMLLDRSDQNAPNQAMMFNSAVLDAKRRYLETHKKADVLANFTIDSPIPYDLASVMQTLEEKDAEMVAGTRGPRQGPYHGKLTRFIQRLQAKINDRRLGFLFGAGDDAMRYEWMGELATVLLGSTTIRGQGGVKIVDFSDVPSDVLPLIIGLVARVVFSLQQWTEPNKRHPVALLCDEAHLYIPERTDAGVTIEGLKSFERIAKEGRKYGVGLTVISQRPAEVNRTVLSQCNNFVAMRLTNAEDQSVIRRLLPDTLGGFTELLPILDIGEALVVGDAAMLPSRIRIAPPRNQPDSATVDFWDHWAKETVENGILYAVEALRKQHIEARPGVIPVDD